VLGTACGGGQGGDLHGGGGRDLARGVGNDDAGAALPASSETRRSMFSWDDKFVRAQALVTKALKPILLLIRSCSCESKFLLDLDYGC
jgi:hypothetical protein